MKVLRYFPCCDLFIPVHFLILCSPYKQCLEFRSVIFESEGYLLLGCEKKLSRPQNKFLISWSLENVCLLEFFFFKSHFIILVLFILCIQLLHWLLLKHAAHRHIGETNMNVYSSRSHTIFRMVRLFLIFLFLTKIKFFRLSFASIIADNWEPRQNWGWRCWWFLWCCPCICSCMWWPSKVKTICRMPLFLSYCVLRLICSICSCFMSICLQCI